MRAVETFMLTTTYIKENNIKNACKLNSVHGRYPQILGSLFVNDNNLVALDIFVQNISQSMFFTGITNIFKTSCEHQFYSFEIQFFHKQRPTLTLMLPNLQQDYTLKCLHKIIYHI